MREYAAIGLHSPKTPENIGSALRAAGCYGAALVVLGGERPKRLKSLGRICTDTSRYYRHAPFVLVDDLRDAIPYDCVPVAVDLLEGARSLFDYVHPERAYYVFGPEDGTLGKSVTGWCRDTIYVPTTGCMNLAACVNVVLYDRAAKRRTLCNG